MLLILLSFSNLIFMFQIVHFQSLKGQSLNRMRLTAPLYILFGIDKIFQCLIANCKKLILLTFEVYMYQSFLY